MHDNYKQDEKIIKDIIYNNMEVASPSSHQLKLHIYYKNKMTHNLVYRNSPSSGGILQRKNVVYKFTCPHPHNHPDTYIGHTRTTLSRRLSMHTQGGSLHAHFIKVHGCKPNKKLLGDNTEIISYDTDPNRLKIKEALMISQYQPTINIQDDKFNRTLLLHCGGDGGCASVSRFTCGPATNFASQVQESVCTLGMDECDYVLRGDRPVGPFITTRSA